MHWLYLGSILDYEKFLVQSLPVKAFQDWALMIQTSHLLSSSLSQENRIIFAEEAWKHPSGKHLNIDFEELGVVSRGYAAPLDNSEVPYEVMNPQQTAVSILIQKLCDQVVV
ncbi:hypothetical protein ONZ45_g7007 [Pleurotus djamor]|nr:hypothetical protein ONZ45_g7007 [Pleurotus djamor]